VLHRRLACCCRSPPPAALAEPAARGPARCTAPPPAQPSARRPRHSGGPATAGRRRQWPHSERRTRGLDRRLRRRRRRLPLPAGGVPPVPTRPDDRFPRDRRSDRPLPGRAVERHRGTIACDPGVDGGRAALNGCDETPTALPSSGEASGLLGSPASPVRSGWPSGQRRPTAADL